MWSDLDASCPGMVQGEVSNACTWDYAKTACPNGWHLPSNSEFQSLLGAIGAGNQLYNAGWGESHLYWSSTSCDSYYGCMFGVNRTSTTYEPQGYAIGAGYGYIRCATADYSALRSYTITYDGNSPWSSGSDGISKVPNSQTGQTPDAQINLDSGEPYEERCGHAFKGWCTVKPNNVSSPAVSSCPGTLYQPGDPIPLPDSTNNITLYAMWQLVKAGTVCGSAI